MTTSSPVKVSVIGAGHVGATFAYGLLLSGVASEIVMIDLDHSRAEGEAMDLGHAVPFGRPTRIRAGEWTDLEGSSAVVVTAGAGQRPGQTRLDLARRNALVVGDVAAQVASHAPSAILIVATNPVDVMTFVAVSASGLAAPRVFGSGTILDTARFRAVLGDRFGVDPRSIHAHVIGEHGDSEVPVWSLANIAGMRLAEYSSAFGEVLSQDDMAGMFEQIRTAADRIIERKGATYYAVASGLVRIVEAVVRDQSTVLTVSSLIDGPYGISGVCLSLPAIVGAEGIQRVLPLSLDESELRALRSSAAVLRSAIEGLPPK
jgi:L-lactate dehydrogenase